MRRLLLVLVCLTVLAAPVRGEPRPGGRWVQLAVPGGGRLARLTYYGDATYTGRVCRSGLPYATDMDGCALGPDMLAYARDITGERWPLVCVEIPGRGAFMHPVWDTGSWAYGQQLHIDLGDTTWQRETGLPLSRGVARARVWVWLGGEMVEPWTPPRRRN